MKTAVDSQKELSRLVYRALSIIDPRCLLAGGAPRNWYFGELAKDLDFYIQTPDDRRCYEQKGVFEGLGFGVKESGDIKHEQYEMMPCLKRVWNLSFYTWDTPIQVMEINHEAIGEEECWYNGRGSTHEPEKLPEVVGDFNNTLSYGWSAYGLTHYPKDFLFSVEYKVVGYKYEAPNVKKLREKYPDFTFVPLEDFEAYKRVVQRREGLHD